MNEVVFFILDRDGTVTGPRYAGNLSPVTVTKTPFA